METIESNPFQGFLVIGSKGTGKKASLQQPVNPPGTPPCPSDSAQSDFLLEISKRERGYATVHPLPYGFNY